MNLAAKKPVGLVLTGGTIGSEVVGEEVRLRTKGPSSELGFLSSDEGPGCEVVRPLRKLSENITPADWVTIADAVVELVDRHGVSGVVVLHGTDTAAYTAAALTFLTAGLEVPVVLTGSNVPATAPDSDAPTNVRDAILAAKHLERGAYLSFSGTPGEAEPGIRGHGCAQGGGLGAGVRFRKGPAGGLGGGRTLCAAGGGREHAPVRRLPAPGGRPDFGRYALSGRGSAHARGRGDSGRNARGRGGALSDRYGTYHAGHVLPHAGHVLPARLHPSLRRQRNRGWSLRPASCPAARPACTRPLPTSERRGPSSIVNSSSKPPSPN